VTIKVKIVFTHDSRPNWAGIVQGLEVPFENLGEIIDQIAETEAYLSRITGLQVRIETGSEG
jgi:hypothetical protein